jgi:hypothetical protein
VNPGMGWTLHFYSNMIGNYGSRLAPSDTLDDWPGLSVIYLRVPWSFLEPQEGVYNWSLFDTPAQRWIAKGKRIAIRVSCCESWLRYATPKWVEAAGAKGIEFEFGQGPKPGGPLWEPDYLDSVFLEKLGNFLAALARRYDGNPNVDFIDVGSFGMWGEGHTGFGSRLNEEQTLAVVKRHVDLHVKLFKQTQLCISDDVAGPTKPGRHFPETDYALSKGVTLRDDSILVQPPPNSWYHAEMAQEFWPRLPVVLEHEHYGGSKQRGAWSGDLLLKSVEDYHASYMSIHFPVVWLVSLSLCWIPVPMVQRPPQIHSMCGRCQSPTSGFSLGLLAPRRRTSGFASANQWAIVLRSTPERSRWVAVLCRIECG